MEENYKDRHGLDIYQGHSGAYINGMRVRKKWEEVYHGSCRYTMGALGRLWRF